MKKEINLFLSLGCHPIARIGVVLIPKNEVLSCSEKLLEKEIRILGYDGFILHSDNTVEPSLEDIVDYSSGQPTLEIIRSFLEKVSSAITHLEIVIDL